MTALRSKSELFAKELPRPPASGKPERVQYTKTIKPEEQKSATPFAPFNFHVSIAKHFFRFGSRVPGHAPNFRQQQTIIELHGTLLRHARFAGKNSIVVRGGRKICHRPVSPPID